MLEPYRVKFFKNVLYKKRISHAPSACRRARVPVAPTGTLKATLTKSNGSLPISGRLVVVLDEIEHPARPVAWVPDLGDACQRVLVGGVGQDCFIEEKSTWPACNAARWLRCTTHAAIPTPVPSGWREPDSTVHRIVATASTDTQLERLKALTRFPRRLGRVDLGPVFLVHSWRRWLDPALRVGRVV